MNLAEIASVLQNPWLMYPAFVAAAQPLALAIVNMRRYAPAPALREIAETTRLIRVAVCVPARNERENIEACLRSVLSSIEVDVRAYVYDDESSDGTDEIVARLAAEDARVIVVARRPLPAHWNGKQHACSRMAMHALAYDPKIDWFLFTDADVRFEPDAVARALGFALSGGRALVSTVPHEHTGSLGEMTLVPLIHFVLMSYLPIGRMRSTLDPAASAACGQFILVSRAAYQASGGHESFRASMHDGVKFPRAVRKAQTWRGFAKNAYEGLGGMGLLVFITLYHAMGQILPWIVLMLAAVTDEWGWGAMVAAGAVSCSLLLRLLLARRFRQSMLNVPLHPLSMAMLSAVQWWSWWLHRTGRRGWKGRVAGGATS